MNVQRKSGQMAVAAAAMALAAMAGGTASGDVILSFGYTDLDGDFNSGSSTFTANAVDQDELRSAGDVTRLVPTIGTAEFDTGFRSLGTLANFTLSMVLSNITATSADVLLGDASFEITDIDGDTISGSIVGEWSAGPFGFMFFNGTLLDVVLDDNGTQDGTFDGVTGSFGLDLEQNEPYNGAIVTLSINDSGNFFLESFSDAATLVSAEIVPAPAGLALLGAGGFLAGRRRRRLA